MRVAYWGDFIAFRGRGIAQHAHADHLPACGAERQYGLALRVRHRGHDFAGERGDDGQDHDGENHARGEIAEAALPLYDPSGAKLKEAYVWDESKGID
jgi:hypothetical protein